ncbi:hypothetical protein D3C81_1224240 [compost metagenome]
MGLASEGAHLVDVEQHRQVGIVVAHLDQRPGCRHADAQLLVQLARQRGFHRLAGLDLAAGELPQTALVLVFGTPGDQHPAIGAADHRRGYVQSFHRRGLHRSARAQDAAPRRAAGGARHLRQATPAVLQERYSALIRTYSWDRSVVQMVSLNWPRPSSMRMPISACAITAAPCSSV